MQDTGSDLRDLCDAFEVSQATFASHMGIPLRTFEDIVTGRSKLRPVHIRAAEMAALQLAADRSQFELLPEKLQHIVRSFKDDL